MEESRFKAELAVLKKYLTSNKYQFIDMDTEEPYLVMATKTNKGNLYTLRIELDEFPNGVPDVYVTQTLYTYDGEPMTGASASMHTLTGKNGWTKICHYGYGDWAPSVSLFMVYVRCTLWLNIYERHLETGEPMDDFLRHPDN